MLKKDTHSEMSAIGQVQEVSHRKAIEGLGAWEIVGSSM